VVYGKANQSGQAVARELSKILFIVIVFVAKNNRLPGGNRKKRQKLEESQKLDEKIDKESRGKTKEPAGKTKKPAGKIIMIRLYPNKSQGKDLNK
jgi:hypothetical protein